MRSAMTLILGDEDVLKAPRIHNTTLLYIFHKIFREYESGALL